MKQGCRFIAGASLLALIACSEDQNLGKVRPQDRAVPLSPQTRAQIEAQGGVCTPNASGPTLCTWSGGGASCTLTFDQNDNLTHITCSVGDVDWECTRPGALFVCRWSDDPDCAEVYSEAGIFEDYLCGDELAERIGSGAPGDGGIGDAGGPGDAAPLDGTGGGPGDAGAGPGDAQPGDGYSSLCTGLDEAACQNSMCHGVYWDPQDCSCTEPGCCVQFLYCEAGSADCLGEHHTCSDPAPSCGGDFVPAHSGSCWNGCARRQDCWPRPVDCTGTSSTSSPTASFPVFGDYCWEDQDCVLSIHQTDCCGTEVALGVAAVEASTFNFAEGLCRADYPSCTCTNLGILTGDGTYVTNPSDVGVVCDLFNNTGTCRTFALP